MKNTLFLFVLLFLYITPSYAQIPGCTDPNAHNYNPNATVSDGSCETCFDLIQNGDETEVDCGGSNPSCPACPIPGCLDPNAHNYNPNATVNDGSCETCSDGVQNGDETGVDCGGSNPNCVKCWNLDVEGNGIIRTGCFYVLDAGNSTSTSDGNIVFGDPTTTHLTFDPNEIQAKSGSSTTTLYINPDGGNINLGNSDMTIYNTSGDVAIDGSTFYVDNSVNRVGVGTSSPNYLLSLGSSIGNTKLALYETSSNYNYGLGIQSGQFRFNIAHEGARFAFFDSSSSPDEIFTISGNGNVGIGDSSPSYKLEVAGSAGKPGGGSWSNSSDRRLKMDIEGFSKGLDLVNQVQPITFRYNGKLNYSTEEEYVGVIAQELQKIAPFMVSDFIGEDGETYLAVDPSAFDFILINAVKELSKEVEILKKENARLTINSQKTVRLESEIAQIKQLLKQQ